MVDAKPPERTHPIPPAFIGLVARHDDMMRLDPVAFTELLLHLEYPPCEHGQRREAAITRDFAAPVDEVAAPSVDCDILRMSISDPARHSMLHDLLEV